MKKEFIFNVAKLVEKLENEFGFSYDEAVNTIMLAKDLEEEGIDLDDLEEAIEEDDDNECTCSCCSKLGDFGEPDEEDEVEERSFDKYNRVTVPTKMVRMIGADQDEEVDVYKIVTDDWHYLLIYNTDNTPYKYDDAEFIKSVAVTGKGTVQIGQNDADECADAFFWYNEEEDCIVCKY